MVRQQRRSPRGDRQVMALLIAGWAAVAAVVVFREPAAAVSMVPMVVTLHRGM